MKELSLHDIQQISKDILCTVDAFCNSHGVCYSLGYGALIGAIRHHGFIPWDDDIDIIMTRPEYEKFIRLFSADEEMHSKGLKLYSPELSNAYFGISRVCDMTRTIVEKYYQWTDDETGLWVDIFVIDALPVDKGQALRHQNQKCFHACGACAPFTMTLGIKRILKSIVKRMVFGNDREKEINAYLELIKALPSFEGSNIVGNFSSPYKEKDIHDKSLFEEYMRTPFGDIEVSIIKKYDDYLRNIYGDYMQLPPLNKRKRGHSNSKYYWK